ncbi:hypothetical protein BJX64DRAFT_301224 [Aspergillus heterothallicus]
MPSIFLIVPGLIGGESARKAFHDLGVQTVLGPLSDSKIISAQTTASDIVIHTATADDLPSVEAVLAGIRQRSQAGHKTIYIHTSGASLIGDNAEGSFKNDFIYDDEKPASIDALPDSAAHREIDLAIVNASKTAELKGTTKFAIMIPPVIYGVRSREKRLSIQLPTMVRYSIKHGYPGMIGDGLAVWNQVHVKDLARGYCAAEIGRILHRAGKVADPTPQTIPRENYRDLFGEYSGLVIGSNARNRANRLRKIGWEAREKKTFASLAEDEIPLILLETGEFNGYAAPVASGKFEGQK